MTSDQVPSAAADELLANEVAEVALSDPEEAARLVAAVAPTSPRPSPSTSRSAAPPPAPPAPSQAAARPTVDQSLPGALAAVLLLQVVAASRFRRLLLGVVGAALLAALVTRAPRSAS